MLEAQYSAAVIGGKEVASRGASTQAKIPVLFGNIIERNIAACSSTTALSQAALVILMVANTEVTHLEQ